MLERKLAEVSNNVLHLSVVNVAVLATEVGKTWNLVEEIVRNGNEDENTDRVHPNNDNGDDVGVSVGGLLEGRHRAWEGLLVDVGVEPAEDTEEGCEDIDTSDGANKLP